MHPDTYKLEKRPPPVDPPIPLWERLEALLSPSERWLQFKHRTEGGFWCCCKTMWPTQGAGNRGPGHHILRRLGSSLEAEAQSCSAVESLSIKDRVLKGKERIRAGREGLRRDSKGGGNALNVVIIGVAAPAITPTWLIAPGRAGFEMRSCFLVQCVLQLLLLLLFPLCEPSLDLLF